MKRAVFFLPLLLLIGAQAQGGPSPQAPETRLLRTVTLDARSLDITDVLKTLAEKAGLNLVVSPSVAGHITVYLPSISIQEALNTIAGMNQLAYFTNQGVLQVMSAAEYEAMFGRRFNDQTIVSVVHLKYCKPAFALAALANIKSNLGKITIDEDTGAVVLEDTPEAVARMKAAIEEMELPLKEQFYELKYAKADKVVEKLRPRIDAKSVGVISSDDRSNRVLLRVLPGRTEDILSMIKALDQPTRQVLIEVRVLQIRLTPQFNQGIDWTAFIKSQGKTKFNIQGMLANTAIGASFGQIGVGTISAADFALALQGLSQISDSKELAFTKILAANNEAAKIHVGDTIPYIITTTTGTGVNAFQSESPRYIDVGLKLDVIPTISDNGMVSMRLRPVVASVVATLASTEGGIPQVNTTEVETSLMVKDGMTVVMAGLIKQEKTHAKHGIPGLMDLPYLGLLFSNRSDSVASSETVIFITPHIIDGTQGPQKVNGTIKSAKKYL